MVMLIRKHRDTAHTLERAIEREDLAIRDSEPLLQRPLADIRDPRRAASPRQMQRSRIPLSSPISVCILRNENERREEHVNVDEHGEHGVRTRTRGRCRRRRRRCRRRRPRRGCARDTGRVARTSSPGAARAARDGRVRGGRIVRGGGATRGNSRWRFWAVCRAVRLAEPAMAKGLRYGQSRPHL